MNKRTKSPRSKIGYGLSLLKGLLLLSAGMVVMSLLTPGFSQSRISDQEVIRRFKQIYYSTRPFDTTFLGVMSMQYPTDNWVTQEIIVETKPEVLIETGTAAGGTALFYATVMENLGQGIILTVDILDSLQKKASSFAVWKKRVRFYRGSSTDPKIVDQFRRQCEGKKTMVILDSDHSKAHVSRELQMYSPLVSKGCYLIVEDTQLSGHPIRGFSREKAGPWEAVQEFLGQTHAFEVDHRREKHLITQHPSGYLRRVK